MKSPAAAQRAASIPERLSVGALGLALVLLVSIAWGTGVFYLVARLGLPSPVRLAWIDGLHAYVGLVGAVFIVGKVLRVGLKYRVRGVPHVVPWQRWMSWSLLALYTVIFISGVLVLLPIPGRLYADLVEVHLLTSVWAAVPTTWHVWHYRRRATPFVGRFVRRARGRRFWIGFALATMPALIVLAQPRTLSQLPQVGGGSTWSQAGLRNVSLSRITTTPDGRTLLAAGNKLYVSRDGKAWKSIGLPDPTGFIPSHSAASAVTTLIQSVAVGRDGIYAGTADGLYLSPASGGPFVDLGIPAQNVVAIAVDPADRQTLWTASGAGPMLSSDGGHSWTLLVAGLERPELVFSIVYLGRRVFASDPTGVFEWAARSRLWVRSSDQASVVALTARSDGRELFAASNTGEVRQLVGDGWRLLGRPGASHHVQQVPAEQNGADADHGEHVLGGLSGVFPLAGRLYAAGTTDGVSASADGGKTWTQLGEGIASQAPGQVIAFQGQLWAATSNGVYRYVLASDPPASVAWWAMLLAATLAMGSLALAVLGLERARTVVDRAPIESEPDYEHERPFLGVDAYLAGISSPPPGQQHEDQPAEHVVKEDHPGDPRSGQVLGHEAQQDDGGGEASVSQDEVGQ